jgi:uronate dehydrogenase
MNVVVMTGAAGRIGTTLREAWHGRFPLRLVDTQDLGVEREGEETLVVDLADFAATQRAVEGAEAVVHLAAIPNEDRFARLLEANVGATYNVFEASRQAGVRRVVFASTNHVTGFYASAERVGPDDPVRPDSLYAVTKVFGEALGRLYADKWGLEVVCLRIGAFGEKPGDADALPMWLSPRDAVRLFTRALVAPEVGFLVAYGVSRIPCSWWDNPGAAALGYEPADEVEPELQRALAAERSPAGGLQGGRFADRDYWVEP